MKKLIPYDLKDSEPIFIEIEVPEEQGGYRRVSRGTDEEQVLQESAGKFEKAIRRVKPAAESIVNMFREMNSPNEIGIEFGLKFGAKTGAFIASADSSATFKVNIKWINEKPQPEEPQPEEPQPDKPTEPS